MKRFTIFHTIETGGPGGAETVFADLISGLDNKRFRSVVLVPDDRWLNRELRRRGIETILLDSPGSYPFAKMTEIIRKEEVDLIHSHLPDQNFFSCLVGMWTGKKTVVTYHGALDPRKKSAIKLWLVRKVAAAAVAVSDFLAGSLKSIGFHPARVFRIYNGVNLLKFDLSAKADIRRELGVAADTKVIGMVANLRSSKGYDFFVRAAKRVLDQFPNARFIAIGDIDKKIGNEMRLLIQELQLDNKFFLLGFRDDVPSLLKQIDIFVLSSTSEGFSLATVEAMAAGCPVVVTRSGGPEEIVENGKTGLMVAPANSDELADAVCDLLRNPEKASELGARARAEVAQKFSLNKMVADYEELYLRCLGTTREGI